mmetsp:Transcript_30374/g.66529  ORF Transcript_30374/g.66529 Transcript_30374/m.66529 type:complete len:348 (+) Transcript_30374:690-1733(+)
MRLAEQCVSPWVSMLGGRSKLGQDSGQSGERERCRRRGASTRLSMRAAGQENLLLLCPESRRQTCRPDFCEGQLVCGAGTGALKLDLTGRCHRFPDERLVLLCERSHRRIQRTIVQLTAFAVCRQECPQGSKTLVVRPRSGEFDTQRLAACSCLSIKVSQDVHVVDIVGAVHFNETVVLEQVVIAPFLPIVDEHLFALLEAADDTHGKGIGEVFIGDVGDRGAVMVEVINHGAEHMPLELGRAPHEEVGEGDGDQGGKGATEAVLHADQPASNATGQQDGDQSHLQESIPGPTTFVGTGETPAPNDLDCPEEVLLGHDERRTGGGSLEHLFQFLALPSYSLQERRVL